MNKGARIAVIGSAGGAFLNNYSWMEDADTTAYLEGYYSAQQLRDIAEVMDETPWSHKIEITSVTDISRLQMAEHLEHLADMLRKGAGLVHGGLYARSATTLMGDIELSEPS